MKLYPAIRSKATQFGSAGILGASFLWLAVAALFPQRAFPQAPEPLKTATPTADQTNFFETKIRPVLAANCLSCHAGKKIESGLSLDSAVGFSKGGDSGPAFISGNPDQSLIIQAIRQSGDLKMPPGGHKLSASEVADFETWIKQGAPWPAATSTNTAHIDELWSLKAVIKPALPKVKAKAWVKNPVDAFVLAQLEANKLKPAAYADRRTLLRRVTYDLTGLAPTPEEMDAFLADKSPDAYSKVVDRLLASPHYGERWARHWLDVARYADTKGYSFTEDRNYPNAYTYRDWVIQAFNNDLPYNQFIKEQIAADRLPETQGDDKKPLAALGFLTLGRRFLNDQASIIDDRIDVTMRGIEGLTVACARCHDHKFDPIPSQDYYSLYAVFASSREDMAPISPKSIRDPWEQYNAKTAQLQASIRKLVTEQVALLRKKVADPVQAANLSNPVKTTLQALRVEAIPEGDALTRLSTAFEPDQKQALTDQQKALQTLQKNAPESPEFAMAMADDSHPHDGYVFKRGKPENRGPDAPRRFLLALSKPTAEREHWTKGSGRLELAEALASKENPLTARVFVNRVWQDHFGAGIVRTPSDFGHQGDKPTNPKLLNYLAASFMENGWSVKKLQKLIVTSATYCQSSDVAPAISNADPDNRLWSRMNRRRLDLEEMRDSVLSVAGALDLKDVGGKSVDIWSAPFTPRRAVYGFVERQNLPGTFRTFDFASPDSTSARRFQTTVPQQALFFMNSPFVVAQAKSLAARPEIQESVGNAQRIRRLYRVLFQRQPDKDELAFGLSYLQSGGGANPAASTPTWQYGFGGWDPSARRESFTGFKVFENGSYHPNKAFPDPVLGYVSINSAGGHPGRDDQHATIRRWTAPEDMTIRITGRLAHGQKEGDGVRGRIVSSRAGLLGEWFAHNSRAKAEISNLTVLKGETIDFIVDPIASDAYDSFAWVPKITTTDGRKVWDAASQFGPPPGPPLTRLELYAQALMMTNEFMFVD